ncbi:organelle RRM domain-containing protein 2, mitochondrial [Rhododendron vialii]|uniref:organelle RRM domain-containing protein 2, mitochondrial n=1 Tax=Rhododendron vialii TaxID=182163 RepID=UPI00265F7B32|nr:organelle RRM domain-containing protein 2, mitochondrial [Rhododendron vialii]
MAMAMRTAAARVAAAKPCGLRGLFSTLTSTSPFIPPPSSQADNRPPPAEPSDNLFVSGLSKRTTTEGLREAFAKFGEVVDARVVTDRVSGYSKGFGFVRYATLEDAAEGIKGMDGKFLDGWVIFAEYARPRPPLPGNNAGPPSYQPGYGSQYGRR